MAYAPPRPGNPPHKRKGIEQHTPIEDRAFFVARRKELQTKRDKIPMRRLRSAAQEVERVALERDIRALDRKIANM
jgi:hypothetical protein